MPILYVHGVNVRTRDGFFAIKGHLERHIAPEISDDPKNVLIDDVFWGDAGASFAWDGASRPRTRILGQGGGATALTPIEGALTASAYARALERVPVPKSGSRPRGGLISSGTAADVPSPPPVRLRDLDQDEISDLLAVTIAAQIPPSADQTRLIVAADVVARDPAVIRELASATSGEDELKQLLDRVRRRAAADAELVAQGMPEWLDGVRDRLSEGLRRAQGLPSYAVSIVAAEVRKPLNEFISVFLGDVFEYLDKRGNHQKPGDIPKRILSKINQANRNKQTRGGEPLVVLSHSMGGQIVYDAVTHFLPKTSTLSGIHVDFWCATASQVGFFEEAKLFLSSDPIHRSGNPVPFPRRNLGVWWNVWDHNDFLSFTGQDIFEGVDDEPFDSGMSLLGAHGGYLMRPSFYRRFADRLKAVKRDDGRTP